MTLRRDWLGWAEMDNPQPLGGPLAASRMDNVELAVFLAIGIITSAPQR